MRYRKPPLTMHILRMGGRGCEQAFHLNAVVYFLGKGEKFGTVHFFAVIFLKTSAGSS